jgi:ankyrin repeat protein
VRHGNLSFNASEVFGVGTPALALAEAAGRADVKQITRIAASGADINSVGHDGITPLWWAAWTRSYDGFAALLQLGANPNAQTTNAPPVMHLIADMTDPRFLSAALKHGGDPNLREVSSGTTPILHAVLQGYEKQVDLLLDAGADPNVQWPISGETLPMTALGASANYKLVYKLFQKGADPTRKDVNGKTLADTIALVSVNASNNGDPWRAKVLEFMGAKGMSVSNLMVK